MEEDFVTYEIAVKLKEKGFREKCLAYYDVEDNVGLLYNTQYTDEILPCQYTDLLQSHNTGEAEKQPDDSECCVDAPTISQVLDWLWDKRKIHVSPTPYLSEVYRVELWLYNIIIYDEVNDCMFIKERVLSFHTYNDAAIAGIEYVLDNLI